MIVRTVEFSVTLLVPFAASLVTQQMIDCAIAWAVAQHGAARITDTKLIGHEGLTANYTLFLEIPDGR